MTTRVLVADDHPFLADGLASAINTLQGFETVGIARNGVEAIAHLRSLRPDCAVIDFAMPGANGLEVLLEFKRWAPHTRVMVLTGNQNPETLHALFDAGPDALIAKSASSERILKALEDIADGGQVFDPALLAVAQKYIETPALSPREAEVLHAIARGQSNADAALSLGLSPKTVDGHRTKLMRKLGVHSTARLILVAVRDGLIDPSSVE
ncbi:response regulator transcription factor [uncultured Sulfitobacter sp.]|uniref:response regulator n=1 Tax=uncultured Sulfitobacter sp. TaxID=191468 RepID=UPI00260DD83D|nr:response regulator transcription factor [uncultured Sulfitobacter sp.]